MEQGFFMYIYMKPWYFIGKKRIKLCLNIWLKIEICFSWFSGNFSRCNRLFRGESRNSFETEEFCRDIILMYIQGSSNIQNVNKIECHLVTRENKIL